MFCGHGLGYGKADVGRVVWNKDVSMKAQGGKWRWMSNGVLGVLSLVLFLLFWQASSLGRSLEWLLYDWGMGWAGRSASADIALITVDDASIANFGNWPWPRSRHAELLQKLATVQPKAIVNTIFFSEPQREQGLDVIQQMKPLLAEAEAQTAAPTLAGGTTEALAAASPLAPVAPPAWLQKWRQLVLQAENDLDHDRRLAAGFAASHALTPVILNLGRPVGNPAEPLPAFMNNQVLAQVSGDGQALPAEAAVWPLAPIASQAGGVGALNWNLDSDGKLRAEPLVFNYFDQFLPSLSLQALAHGLHVPLNQVQVQLGRQVQVGGLSIPVDGSTQMPVFFYPQQQGREPFIQDSYFDVLTGKVPLEKYRGKWVLIGATAAGIDSLQSVPTRVGINKIHVLAHTLSTLTQRDFIQRPGWALWLRDGLMLVVTLYLMLGLNRLRAGPAALISVSVALGLVLTSVALFASQLLWLPLLAPALFLLFGHGVLTTKQFFLTERGKEKTEAMSAESLRMLGLAYQGQGQLDMAYESFRKCPLDAGMQEVLYSLALDFERKRQFNKAEAVLQSILEVNPKFKDATQRVERLRAMQNNVLMTGATSKTGTMILDVQGMEKPMLGRYEIERELGKGAMGVVYFGRDPKIGRVVAIKTMALSQEFDAQDLDEARSRFFREAETAGRLNHPNIVTIYDAGEEHDLAYIAMEFLHGHDLLPYTKAGQLLPLPLAAKVVKQVAEALDYAHKQNVVHRDIKPANIMFDPKTVQVKVTDFGIARITDASKTKTGMVLGTPSYMSPEQLTGRKVDGRSDLFSLGVMLYQLSSGQLPFVADSMTELMYRIANDAPKDVRLVNPQLPAGLAAILARALAKDPAQRFQNGAEFAAALQQCFGAHF